MTRDSSPKRLNIGCGKRRVPGFLGVDLVPRAGADIVAPAHQIPLPDGSCDAIMAIHLFEHFNRWEVPVVLAEWRRLLQRGGELVLELPNLRKCCENILAGLGGSAKSPDQLGMWGLYGDPTTEDVHMRHHWGWTPQTLGALLEEHGFTGVRETTTQFHPAGRDRRDMRIEAVRQ